MATRKSGSAFKRILSAMKKKNPKMTKKNAQRRLKRLLNSISNPNSKF